METGETIAGSSSDSKSVSVRQFVAARVAEITSLTAQIDAGGGVQGRGKGFSFQHVSKHMRRRAVSHNPKRLPSRLRISHLAQLRKSSGGVVKKPKRPRRKYRKRSDGDILEYNRRQLVNPMWLESHIWHAKRFHMTSAWGRKLAFAPTAKCFRSLFRAARQNVIMQDISYLSTLEVCGPMSILLKVMARLLPEGFSATTPIWNKEILAHMVSPSTSRFLGPIKYLWISPSGSLNANMLIWSHPAMKATILDELKNAFELAEKEVVIDFPEFPTKAEKKYLWKIANNQNWYNETTGVNLKDLNGCFNRIRLVGPRTLPILKEILKICRFPLSDEGECGEMEEQEAIWKSIKKIANVPDCTVIPLNVIDPRRDLPHKRQRVKKLTDENNLAKDTQISPEWNDLKLRSPLWSDNLRRLVLHNKTSDDKLSISRSKNLIPGTTIGDGENSDVVPIALVIRSHSAFPGVDMILPCGWLMAFWISLSYRCVRSYAQEFNDYLSFEENRYSLHFSTSTLFSPDSTVYQSEDNKISKLARAKYFSYPPAKRHNLIKLGCAFPFSTDWTRFLRFLIQSVQCGNAAAEKLDVEIMRHRKDLQILSECLRTQNPDHDWFSQNSSKLFPIQVVLVSGAIEKGACICLPTKEDLGLLVSGKYSEVHILQQPMKDINERKRVELSCQHHKRLSHLRKKRKVARRAASEPNKNFDLKSRLSELNSKSEVEKYNQDMNNLWLNENVEEVLSKQDREIMGFTEYAHYSFVRGKSAGSGYLLVCQLKRLIEIHGDINKKGRRALNVLVRNWGSSLTYHWAKLEFQNFT